MTVPCPRYSLESSRLCKTVSSGDMLHFCESSSIFKEGSFDSYIIFTGHESSTGLAHCINVFLQMKFSLIELGDLLAWLLVDLDCNLTLVGKEKSQQYFEGYIYYLRSIRPIRPI